MKRLVLGLVFALKRNPELIGQNPDLELGPLWQYKPFGRGCSSLPSQSTHGSYGVLREA